MNKLLGAAIIALMLILPSSAAAAQNAAGAKSGKAAVVVELQAPKFDDVMKDRVSDGTTFYQKGNKRSSSQRRDDATKFCKSINYAFGKALEYKTFEIEDAQFDYLKRVICFD